MQKNRQHFQMPKRLTIRRPCEPKGRIAERLKCGRTDEDSLLNHAFTPSWKVMYSLQNHCVIYIVYTKKEDWKKLSEEGGLIQEVIFLNVHVYILYFPNTTVKSSSFILFLHPKLQLSMPSQTHQGIIVTLDVIVLHWNQKDQHLSKTFYSSRHMRYICK